MAASIKLIEHVLDQFKGTPEEFGALLAVATGPTDLDNAERRSAKYRARAKISKFDRGRELLWKEEESNSKVDDLWKMVNALPADERDAVIAAMKFATGRE